MSETEKPLDEQNLTQQEEIIHEVNVTQFNTSIQNSDNLAEPLLTSNSSESSFDIDSYLNPDLSVFFTKKDVSQVNEHIEKLRKRIIMLVPVEANLLYLTGIREPRIIINDRENIVDLPFIQELSKSFESISSSIQKKVFKKQLNSNYNLAKESLNELSAIQAQVTTHLEVNKISEIQQRINNIAAEVELRIAEVNRSYDSAFDVAKSREESIKAVVSNIEHQKLRIEAEMHYSVISSLVKKLDDDILTNDVLSNQAQAAVGVMVAIEKRRLLVEKLVSFDQKLKRTTIRLVITYLWGVILLVILLPIVIIMGLPVITSVFPLLNKHFSPINLDTSRLENLKIPLFGIPSPVIIWSLIGSFAAMIHRFNRKPICDFDDAVKWLWTRPVQGIIMGSAFYLVLNSGLFVLTGGTPGSEASQVRDEIILVLSFLVGFSDRFVDSVFNALVDRYSRDANQAKEAEKDVVDYENKVEQQTDISATQYTQRNIKRKKRYEP